MEGPRSSGVLRAAAHPAGAALSSRLAAPARGAAAAISSSPAAKNPKRLLLRREDIAQRLLFPATRKRAQLKRRKHSSGVHARRLRAARKLSRVLSAALLLCRTRIAAVPVPKTRQRLRAAAAALRTHYSAISPHLPTRC